MDCDKLDELAIDLVDPEGAGVDRRALGRADGGVRRALDAQPLEQAEAHLASCARCAALVERLRAGQRAADALTLDDPSSLLEARILAAAEAARPRRSLPRRIARAVSTAGGWAMRPQVAMAAVLVLMVGSSILVLRGGVLPGARRTKVTDEGTPVATLEPPSPVLPPEGAPAVVPGGAKDKAARKKDPASPPPLHESAKAELDEAQVEKKEAEAKPTDSPSDVPKQAPKATTKADLDDLVAAAPAMPGADGKGGAAAPKPAPAAPTAPMAPSPPAEEASKPLAKSVQGSGPAAAPPQATSFDDAMSAYKEGRWAIAAKGFDTAASEGHRPSTSLLYAARSHRALGSCANALVRYRKLLQAYSATPEAPTAALEGGRCAKANGDLVEARSLFERAKAWAVTKKEAEAELAALASPPPPPAKAKAAKPSTAADDAH